MTHTVTVDEHHRERQVENSINRAVRHCCIGKVTSKATFKENLAQNLKLYAANLANTPKELFLFKLGSKQDG
jgi:hypothetical protein